MITKANFSLINWKGRAKCQPDWLASGTKTKHYLKIQGLIILLLRLFRVWGYTTNTPRYIRIYHLEHFWLLDLFVYISIYYNLSLFIITAENSGRGHQWTKKHVLDVFLIITVIFCMKWVW